MSTQTVDIAVVGGGIVGLSIARELRKRDPALKIAVFEKEPKLGKHSSGRNSGVIHSGLYYKEDTLKAKLCAEGGRALAAYCRERGLPLSAVGKVVLPTGLGDDHQIDLLYKRGRANGARLEIVDEKRLREIEPEAFSITGRALYSPDTAVFDPHAILAAVVADLRAEGVEVHLGATVHGARENDRLLETSVGRVKFGHAFNAAGLHADVLAKAFGAGRNYTILPFKGLYWKLSPKSGLKFNGHVYPVPDMNVPFLGVHFTKSVQGGIYLGPTAIPALGRENYKGLEGIDWMELGPIFGRLVGQYLSNKQGFRNFAHAEAFRFLKSRFVKAAKVLVPNLKSEYVVSSEKVGIRAQLLDLKSKELVMDFLVEQGEHSTHVLNAVSPAFTSAFSFASWVVDDHLRNRKGH